MLNLVGFGNLVKSYRGQKRLTQATLALDVFGDEQRKADISRIENGKAGTPQEATIRRLKAKLDIPQEAIDALRTGASVDDTFLETLQARAINLADSLHLTHDLVKQVARRNAIASHDNFDSALAGIEEALRVTAADRAKPLSNLGGTLDRVFADINARNDRGDLEGGTKELKAALAAKKDRIAEEEQGYAALLAKGVAQAVLERSVPDAVAFTLERLAQDVPDRAERFAALRAEQDVWYVRGRDKGLNFDLEVSIALAKEYLTRALDSAQRLAAGIILGSSMVTLGEREIGTERLVAAVDVYEAALKEQSGRDLTFNWAMAQNNLGAALASLARKERSIARFEKSISAYQAALMAFTRNSFPLQWAMAQNNLGIALADLGGMTDCRDYLELALDSYKAALDEYTKEETPVERATTLNNLGNALTTLAVWDLGTSRLHKALAAYNEALTLGKKEVVPLDWATWSENMAVTELRLAEHAATTRPRRHLLRSLKHVNAALEVYDSLQIPSYCEQAKGLRDHLMAALSEP